jgi:spore coat polysaccharide biosynthesis protein SpsF
VLDRYYQAAMSVQSEVVVRLTADCPLLDPTVIDKVVETFLTGQYDYVSNTLSPTYPDGLDTEIFTFAALKQAWEQAELKSEREHVTSFIYKRPDQFRLGNVANETDLSHLRWTVDEPRDLELVQQIYAHFQAQSFGMNDIINLLKTRPDLSQLNSDIIRNEGYLKSLQEDSVL